MYLFKISRSDFPLNSLHISFFHLYLSLSLSLHSSLIIDIIFVQLIEITYL